jgi:nucleoside-diphosphate-sugar epimerase
MKVFVAGGTGVLGRASVKALVHAGHEVSSTARNASRAAVIAKLGARPVNPDLFNADAVRRAISGADAVVRLTTKVPSVTSMRDRKAWAETIRLRTEGARILVNAAIAERVPIYMHESVTFLYRDGGDHWLDEQAPVDGGGSAILRATLDGEREAARFSDAGGRGIVLRFAGLYGPDAPSAQEMIRIATKRRLPQLGLGTNYFSSVFVRDAGRAVAAALSIPPGVYNVADDHPMLFAEYLQVLASALRAAKPVRLPGFLGRLMFGEVWNYLSRSQRISNTKLKQASSWKPSVTNAIAGWAEIVSDLHYYPQPFYAMAR